jgi:ABC-type amino acid transport substrate-binding protein
MRNILVAAALAATLASATAAAQTLADIKKRGLVRIGYSETSAPFAFKGKEGTPAGYTVELCKRVVAGLAAATGVKDLKTEWVSLTPATRVDAVASGQVDLECGTTTMTLERRGKVDFSVPVFVDASTLIARKAVVTNLSDLQGKKVAVAANTTTVRALEAGLKKRFINAEVVRTKTVAEGFELLKEGKVDALAGDRTALVGSFFQGGGAEGLTVLGEDLSIEPYALMLRKGDADFRLAVDRVLAQLYRSGEIEAVYGAWLGPLGKPTIPLLMMYMLNGLPD